MAQLVDRQRVARLLRRAGFGASVAEIDEWTAKGYAATVEHLLAFPPAGGRPDDAEVLALETAAPGNKAEGFDLTPYQRWWLSRMATTEWPLEEKLTLHWHDHFATAYSKVARAKLMVRQNRLLRNLAGGGFRQLAKAVTEDAAMLLWLDGDTNQAAKPNENYAREFMELFTLGVGRYTQEDVRQAARAFTGYVVDAQGNVAFNAGLHDGGEKVILGNRGNFGSLDMADLVLDRHPEGPVAARYVARRLAGFFHHPDPEAEVVEAMASAFAAGDYQIKPMLAALFHRPEFTDGPRLTVKSPAELVAGAMRALQLAGAPAVGESPQARPGRGNRSLDEFARSCAAMGQALFNPPNVSGWKGGAAWANTATVLARYNFAARLARVVSDDQVRTVLDTAGGVPKDSVRPWMDRLGLLDLLPATQAALDAYHGDPKAGGGDPQTRARGVLTLLLASPDYHLR
jgi:uncharacterized protein (DUF1800 family)